VVAGRGHGQRDEAQADALQPAAGDEHRQAGSQRGDNPAGGDRTQPGDDHRSPVRPVAEPAHDR